MKKLFQLSALIILMGGISCKKNRSDVTLSPISATPAPTIEVRDTIIQLPYNRAFLSADIHTSNNATVKIQWKKIEGPDQYILSNLLVSDLVEGIFRFEITVDQFGKIAKDTLAVTVLPDDHIYTKEVVFENLQWSCTWDCYFTITNALVHIPAEAPYKVYIKINPSVDWDIVLLKKIFEYSDGAYANIGLVSNKNLTILNNIAAESKLANSIVKIIY